MYERLLRLDHRQKGSFFLWGLRQAGKSSLLKETFPQSIRIDLLRASERVPLETHPGLLRERLLADAKARHFPVIIDEVQKVPALLDEVHALIEDEGLRFALCGSSARKLKRGHANLLGGRARRFELFGLSAREVGKPWALGRMLNSGYLPTFYDDPSPKPAWRAYVENYLKEEILEEGLVRRLPPFSRFLETASLADAEIVSWESYARDVGVSAEGIKGYFEILVDTQVGLFCPSFQRRPKRRTRVRPKFYFSDVGLVNFLAKRGQLEPGSELFGKAFENWVFHELTCYRAYRDPDLEIAYWSLTTGSEVDFILGRGEVAVEAKATDRIRGDHLKGLQEFKAEYPGCRRRIIVSLESKPRRLESGIDVLPYPDFVRELWTGALTGA